MIAFSWRQFRPLATIGLAGLGVVAIVLAVTGPHMVSVYDTAVAACKASGGQSSACNNPVSTAYGGLRIALTALVLVVPALIGMFWGAPLIAHELETGTFRLAWTQSVSRLRWLLVKLGLVGLASLLAAALLSLMASWWLSPVDKANPNRFSPSSFALHGFVPGGYAVFAFALAATVGLLLRRTLPAMAVTLAGFVAARVAVTFWIRQHYMHAVTTSVPLTPANAGFQFNGPGPGAGGSVSVNANAVSLPNAWVTGVNVVDKAGQAPTSDYIKQACGNGVFAPPPFTKVRSSGGGLLGGHASASQAAPDPQAAFNHCIQTIGLRYHEVVTYQPANRFWTFQTIETALFVVLALALAGGCAWWVRHRIT
jgi:ABC-type transport system involved in multi-copper enzyme maturation permease subunit